MADKFPAQLFVIAEDVDEETGEVGYYSADAVAENVLGQSEEQEVAVYSLVGVKKGQLKAVFSE